MSKERSRLTSSRSRGRRQQQLGGDRPACLVERTVEQRQAETDKTSKIRDKQGRPRQRRGNSVNWSFARQPRQTTEAGKEEQRLLQVEAMELAVREGKQANQYTAAVARPTFINAGATW